MPHVSYHSIRHTTPHYGLSHARQRREPSAGGPDGFTGTFRRAGRRIDIPHASHRDAGRSRRTRGNANATRPGGGWSAALTILLVANLAAPAAGAIPRRNLVADPNDEDYSLPHIAPLATHARPDAHAIASSSTTPASEDVDIRPVEYTRFRSDYTLMDMLRIVAASRSPFEKFGESLSDAYAVFTGDAPAPQTRRAIARSGRMLDIGTGLVPQVRMSRLPGDISHVAVEQVEGRAPGADDISTLMQVLDPRTWRADRPTESVVIPVAPEARQPPGDMRSEAGIDRMPAEIPRQPDDTVPVETMVHLATDNAAHDAENEAPDEAENGIANPATNDTPSVARVPEIDAIARIPRITGEHDHLAGYAQPIPAERPSADADSQDAIQAAFGNLSSLRLLRGNRADLRASRDYSIVGHRAALRKAMRNIDRDAPLLQQQQQQVAAATAMYYSDNPQAEAFCQENAEILFHLLLESGVPEDRIRMITFQPQHRPAHVMVLYTESETFIDMLHVATPQPLIYGRPDGIGDRMFSRAIFLTRDTTLLLDPWSRTKATGFAGTSTDRDVQQRLNRVLGALGHRDGHPFVVSITRPFGTHAPGSRLRSTSSSGSPGSPVSLGSESNGSVFDPPTPQDPDAGPDLTSSSDDTPEDGF
ncbi:hypothetical protein [Pandoraea anhela]|uniref:Uncharacterized protein n=1 Tax=Pandoraea anhela TaxID=2508295 RepID=A0A5E4SGL7_9BURK|nr:hypothetical protein [Pandoraea anhela]VVD73634.1 hypothetical protein PAN31108_00731 [Pandoraea anhela]